MGSNASIPHPKEGPSSETRDASPASPAWSKHKWGCHCDADPEPVKKEPRVLTGDERFIPQERRAMRCALCSYVADLPWYHCKKCFVYWEEDPASFATESEIREKERQDSEARRTATTGSTVFGATWPGRSQRLLRAPQP